MRLPQHPFTRGTVLVVLEQRPAHVRPIEHVRDHLRRRGTQRSLPGQSSLRSHQFTQWVTPFSSCSIKEPVPFSCLAFILQNLPHHALCDTVSACLTSCIHMSPATPPFAVARCVSPAQGLPFERLPLRLFDMGRHRKKSLRIILTSRWPRFMTPYRAITTTARRSTKRSRSSKPSIRGCTATDQHVTPADL